MPDAPNAFASRPNDLAIGPLPDARIFIGGEIRGSHMEGGARELTKITAGAGLGVVESGHERRHSRRFFVRDDLAKLLVADGSLPRLVAKIPKIPSWTPPLVGSNAAVGGVRAMTARAVVPKKLAAFGRRRTLAPSHDEGYQQRNGERDAMGGRNSIDHVDQVT